MQVQITKKQQMFIDARADEVLYGGAAGGGKSFAQILDALIYALKYKGSKQLILRRTFAELEQSIIRTSLELYPREVASYNASKHTWAFKNGSIVDFGYCDNDKSVSRYQSAEYDTIRFDELTHFTEYQYTYLLSRLRGTNNYPKQIKSSTNPGNVGHMWVRKRFIDTVPPYKTYKSPSGITRVFIPALVKENKFLMQKDPNYVKRLENLNEKDKRALLYGDWDIFEGQYFDEFNRGIHVVKPFEIPKDWRRYISIDYGLDMLACLWIALDFSGKAYVYKELYESGLIISDAAKRIHEVNGGDEISMRFAPPDMWNRRQETGKSAADIFLENGLYFYKSNNNRVQGWYDLKEWLKPYDDEQGIKTARLVMFENCTNLIRTLPALQYDEKNPNDVSGEPHELTHAPDALRGFIAGRPCAPVQVKPISDEEAEISDEYSFINFGT